MAFIAFPSRSASDYPDAEHSRSTAILGHSDVATPSTFTTQLLLVAVPEFPFLEPLRWGVQAPSAGRGLVPERGSRAVRQAEFVSATFFVASLAMTILRVTASHHSQIQEAETWIIRYYILFLSLYIP